MRSDPDKTGKFATITRSRPRDYVSEGIGQLRHAVEHGTRPGNIKEALSQFLAELEREERAA